MSVDERDDAERRAGRRKALGAELRQAFGQVADEPIPAALEALARRLDERLHVVDGERAPAAKEARPVGGPARPSAADE